MVGDGPIENIMRSMIEATKVRIPAGRGTVNMLANDSNITVHISPDKCELSTNKKNEKSF